MDTYRRLLNLARAAWPFLAVALIAACIAVFSSLEPVAAHTPTPNTQHNHTLTVTVTGNGDGTVTSNTGGINCRKGGSGTCTTTIASNFTTAVILTATPVGGSRFSGWGGNCSGSGTCSLRVDQGNRSVTANFDLPPQSLTITPTSGTPRTTTVTVSGSNYSPGVYHPIVFGTTNQVGQVLVNQNGNFNDTFEVPWAPQGPHTVTVHRGTATFTVTPGITLSPTSGPAGSDVQIEGDGFLANQGNVRFQFGPQTLDPVTADREGSVRATFTVPGLPAGSYQVRIGSADPVNFTVASEIRLEQTRGSPGETIRITGSGFRANTSANLSFDSETVRSVPVDSDGRVNTNFQIPETPAGPTTVSLEGRSVSFTVTPALTLETGSATPGAFMMVTGTGYFRNERNIVITIGGATAASGISADGRGSWTYSIEVPSLAAGTHQVAAHGASTARSNAPSAPLVLGSMLILDRPSGPPGTELRISGSGFGPRENVRIAMGGSLATRSVRADNQGAWTVTLNVPASAGGLLPVSATGARGHRVEGEFTVTADVSLSQSSGSPGSSVAVQGSGFPANAGGISLRMADVQLTSVSADAQGSFDRSFTVPQAPADAYMITVGGARADLSVPFEVTPRITLNGDVTDRRVPITVRGFGFSANEENISVTLDHRTIKSGITANSRGSWSAEIEAPSLPSGSYSLRASGSNTAVESVSPVTLTLTSYLSLDRASGSPGETLKVSGGGFSLNTGVTITAGDGLTQATAVTDRAGSWSTNLLIPVAPGGNILIEASGGDGQAANASFMITPTARLSEPFSRPGGAVEIIGHGFQAGQSLSVNLGNGVIASPLADSRGSWTAKFTVPEIPAGNRLITIKTTDGEMKMPFLVSAGISVSDTRTSPANLITVSGSGFGASERGITVTVDQDIVAAGISADRRGSWSVDIPAPVLPAGSYEVSASGPVTSPDNVSREFLTLIPGLEMVPNKGEPGTRVSVTGRGFGANQKDILIEFGTESVALVSEADESGEFTVSFDVPEAPSGGHFVDHSGTTVVQDSGPGVEFQVIPAIILDEKSGHPGLPVQIDGMGFPANDSEVTIAFDGVSWQTGVSTDELGSFTVSLDLPLAAAGIHEVSAIVSGVNGVTNPSEEFEITPDLTLSLESGNIGDAVEVTGLGFSPQSQASVVYSDGLLDTTIGTDGTGTFSARLIIPASDGGEHLIAATDMNGFSAVTTFTVENTPPPLPVLLLPEDGSSGGLLGGFQPELSWGPVEDPSGVTYGLQISSSPEFTSTVFEQTGLTAPAHAIAEEAALDRGRYYWRVRAVDMANNAGPWTEPFEMKSGILPVWLIPVVAILLAVMAGGGGYAYYSRRRYQSAKAPAFPEMVRDVRTAPALPSTASTGGAAPTPRPQPRLALPSSPLRRRQSRTPEEQAQLRSIVDFLKSLPLLEVTQDLGWLEELVEVAGSSEPTAFERVLEGELDLRYQPAWMRHPTFELVRLVLQGHPFLEELEAFVGEADGCAVDMVALLRQVYRDMENAVPDDTAKVYQWLFVLGVVKHSLVWFRGSYLREPSVRDYHIEPFDEDSEAPLFTLEGEDGTPFAGPLVKGLTEADAIAYRDIHIALRGEYINSGNARLLASRLASLEILHRQMISNLEQLGDIS